MAFHRWRSPRDTWDRLKPSAREQRSNRRAAEQALWKRLRNRQCLGHKLRRQHAVGGYIVDFVCPEAALVIEVDGGIHKAQTDADALRTAHLQSRGLRVLRFRNEEVMTDLDGVLKRIQAALGAQDETEAQD